ncbi:MAG TPA: CBS domain-containing protein [Terriglobia bacterium]|nr:CBS domain-containing protein [Terriglobia bacterium]
MTVREIMTADVTTVQETEMLLDAAMIFARSSLRHLPVLRDSLLVGVITERDVKRFAPGVLSGVTSGKYNEIMETTPLSRVMTRDPMTLKPSQDVADAAEIFSTKRFGCLPVVDDGKLVGIITTTDMLRLMARIMKDKNANK